MSNGNHIPDLELDLLALGALDAEERRPLESHVASCVDCTLRMAEARGRVAAISLAAPVQQPPAAARARLMQRVAESKSPAAPALTRDAAFEFRSPAPKRSMWNFGWAFAAAALAVFAVILWINNERMDRELHALQQTSADLQQKSVENRHMMSLFTAPDTIQVALAATPGHEQNSARVHYNQREGMLVYTGTMPAIPSNRSYELWLVPMSGDPIAAGVFRPDAAGRSVVMMPPIPAGITAKAFAVTIEPAGGMPKATGPMVQMGAVS